MSIDYNCGIMVGLTYSEAIARFSEEDIDRLLDEDVLSSASPWYDSPRTEHIIGKWLQYDDDIDVSKFQSNVDKIKQELSELMDGVEFKVFCTMTVT